MPRFDDPAVASRPARKGAVIVGASSGVGRALACELARKGYDLVVAARESPDLQAVASDVSVRFAVSAASFPLDLADPDLDAGEFTRFCCQHLDRVDAVLFPAGVMSGDDRGPTPSPSLDQIVLVNYFGVIRLISAFSRILEERGEGVIVAFSSIAADAPRGTNTVYSSSKAALDVYCQGLRHHLAQSKVRVQVYVLGYVDTQMTFGKKLLFPIVSPDRVARHVIGNLHRDRGRTYFPRFWALVVLLLKLLPWSVYKRLSF